MNWEILSRSQLVENLGWTLLHSVWQIALIGFVLFALLRAFQKFSANTRYIISVFALAFALILLRNVGWHVGIRINPGVSLIGSTKQVLPVSNARN